MENETSIAGAIGFGVLLIAFLVMLIVLITSKSKRSILEKENKLQALEKEKQVELFRATAKAEEEQKVKIAANLHDQIIPVLLVKARSINNQILELEKGGVVLEGIKTEVESLMALANDIREVAHDLIPKLFTSFGLLKSLEVFIKDLNQGNNAVAEFHNSTTFTGKPPFSKNDQLIIYRISLEILNNLSKHSNYKYLNVSLEDMNENFILLFSHDGTGITTEEISEIRDSSNGIGLKSLQSRTLLLNAHIEYYTDASVSYVKLIIPIKK